MTTVEVQSQPWTKTYLRWGFRLGVFLTVADMVSTWLFLHFQTGVEGNPLIAHTFDLIGVIPALLFWTAFRIGAIWLLSRTPKWQVVACGVMTYVLTMWTLVDYNNYFVGRLW